MLGTVKNLGQGKPKVPQNHSYGVKNLQGPDTWNAAQCLHGQPVERELLPDSDLGKSTKPNC